MWSTSTHISGDLKALVDRICILLAFLIYNTLRLISFLPCYIDRRIEAFLEKDKKGECKPSRIQRLVLSMLVSLAVP